MRPIPLPYPARPLLATLLLVALAVLGACQGQARRSEGERTPGWYVAHGEYSEAVRVAEREAKASPNDPALQRQYKLASVAFLLDEGRRLSFEGKDAESLVKFEAALAILPEEPQVVAWYRAAQEKLALHWLKIAAEHHAQENLNAAKQAYEKSLTFDSDDPRAQQGFARVLIQLNYRMGLGESYYKDGVRELDRLFLEEARHGFDSSQHYNADHERAKLREQQTRTLLADMRANLAMNMEVEGRFAAARNEYRLALLLDEQHQPSLQGFERTDLEARAADELREAERALLKKNFDKAAGHVEEGQLLTLRQGELFLAMADRIEQARLQQIYDAARGFEADYQYEEAVAKFAELLDQAPYFLDSIARKDTLEDYIAEASKLYGKLDGAADDAARLSLLRQIAVFWPEYLDVQERLAALEAQASSADQP